MIAHNLKDLTSLNLSKCNHNIGWNKLGTAAASAIANGLKKLVKLDVSTDYVTSAITRESETKESRCSLRAFIC